MRNVFPGTGLVLVWLLLFPLSLKAQGPSPAPLDESREDFVEVVVTGEGIDKDSALKDALRKALEQGGKNEIFSETQVENFQLMRDTIIARAEGIVTDYRILEEKPGIGGTFRVRIRALVSKQALVDNWGAIQNVLNQIGRPKIMVYIRERIDGREEEQSIFEVELEKKLLQSGFDLVSRRAVQERIEKEKADAAAEGNVARMQALAKGFEAQFFVTGTANANRAGIENVYGIPIAFYNCDVQFKAYYTDSGKLLASVPLPNARGGARGRKEFSPQAGKQALSNAAPAAIEDLYQQIMRQWATQISAGGELILEVQGLKFKAANDLKKHLQEVDRINSVNMQFSKGIATYRINARMGANELAELLTEPPYDELLEIHDLELNSIQAHASE